MHNIFLSLFLWKKKNTEFAKCFNSALRLFLKSCLFLLVTKVFIIQFMSMVFLRNECWVQPAASISLESTGIKTGWQENFTSHSRERSGLTCTARWSSASEEGNGDCESSHPVNSAFSLCLMVGGWTCALVCETVESQNPLQGTCAMLRTAGRPVVFLVESLLVNSPEKPAEVRSFFPISIMADLLKHRAQKWQGASSFLWVKTKLFCCCCFTQSMLKANQYYHNPFLLISSCKTASVKIGQKVKRMTRKGILFPNILW